MIVRHGDRDAKWFDEQLTIRSTLVAGRRSKPINRIKAAAPPALTKLDLGVAAIQSDGRAPLSGSTLSAGGSRQINEAPDSVPNGNINIS